MFNNFSPSSPFSVMDKKKSTKQSTLSSFISMSKPKASSRSSQSPFMGLANRTSKKIEITEKDQLDSTKVTVIIDEDDKEGEQLEPVTKKTRLNPPLLQTDGEFNESIEIETVKEIKTNSFKHMKPIEKREFVPSDPKTLVSSSGVTSKSRSTESKPVIPVRKPVLASKQRQLPWSGLSGRKISNPRAQNKPSLSRSSSTIGSGSMEFSKEQKRVIDMVLYERKNIFYTGSAGTGKSFLLKEIIRKLRNRYGDSTIAVTASTGLAATNIEGTTVNRFSGIGLGSEPVNTLIGKIRKKRAVVDRWRATKVLIIDEISMIDSLFFDKLNEIAKSVRENSKPFGGIQLILTGDFFQLPPVSLSKNSQSRFCFDARSWRECIDETILLTKVFRQQNDSDLIEMLNALRVGQLSKEMRTKFKRLERPLNYADGIFPTELYPTRDEVDRANLERLNSLSGRCFTFQAKDTLPPIPGNAEFLRKQLDGLMCAKVLQLKEGAQVMYLKNEVDDPLIVNGSIGKISCFVVPEMWNIFTKKFKEYERLKNEDLLLVASRFIGNENSGEDERMLNEYLAQIYNNVPLKELLRELVSVAKRASSGTVLPVVKFTVNSYEKYRYKLIEPVIFSPETNKELAREQLPILLSWALSIHKSQGQTLSRVKVDLTKIFEKGQVYVALSRCVDTANLQIVNFDDRVIRVSDDVAKFYDNLRTIPT